MRILNIAGGLSGACALIMLAAAHHLVRAGDPDISFVYLAAAMQLSAGLAGLVLAGRTSQLNLIAGAMILGGATLFAGVVYLSMINDNHPFHMLAPIGGALVILGWIVLAFAKPN